jgi:hypothetical protein
LIGAQVTMLSTLQLRRVGAGQLGGPQHRMPTSKCPASTTRSLASAASSPRAARAASSTSQAFGIYLDFGRTSSMGMPARGL